MKGRVGQHRDYDREARASAEYETLRDLDAARLSAAAATVLPGLPDGLSRQQIIALLIEERLTEGATP